MPSALSKVKKWPQSLLRYNGFTQGIFWDFSTFYVLLCFLTRRSLKDISFKFNPTLRETLSTKFKCLSWMYLFSHLITIRWVDIMTSLLTETTCLFFPRFYPRAKTHKVCVSTAPTLLATHDFVLRFFHIRFALGFVLKKWKRTSRLLAV